MFLFTGGRFDEVVNLKWSDIKSHNVIEYFFVENYKVNLQLKIENEQKNKKFPIFPELKNSSLKWVMKISVNPMIIFLFPIELLNQKQYPTSSKSFSHYRNQCGVSKSLSLKHLRKTYIYLFNDNRKITDLIFHYDLKNIITRNKIFSF